MQDTKENQKETEYNQQPIKQSTMERETRIKEFMSKYGLKKLPLYCDGGRYVGYLDETLSYIRGHFYYLKNRNVELLVAVDMLPIIENIIKIWNKPISVNVDGKVIERKDSQNAKAIPLISVTLVGSFTLSKALHLSNIFDSITVMLSGISILIKEEQLVKVP